MPKQQDLLATYLQTLEDKPARLRGGKSPRARPKSPVRAGGRANASKSPLKSPIKSPKILGGAKKAKPKAKGGSPKKAGSPKAAGAKKGGGGCVLM